MYVAYKDYCMEILRDSNFSHLTSEVLTVRSMIKTDNIFQFYVNCIGKNGSCVPDKMRTFAHQCADG